LLPSLVCSHFTDYLYFVFTSRNAVKSKSFGTVVLNGLAVSAPDDRLVENLSGQSKNYSSAILSKTNITWTILGLNSGFHSEKTAA
jgi:hypothetical protein